MKRSFNRRHVLRGGLGGLAAGVIPFPEWLARYSSAEAAPPLVRYGVSTATGTAMLAKYRTAVGTMMQGQTGDPCAWLFQWYTHQIRDDQQKSSVIAGLPASQRPLATDMWNTCQAHFGRPLQYFLPWHRMYVYFLERIVRKACGDPAFTLPYWDYLDAAQRPIPAAFRTSTSSPLYRPDRNSGSPGTANVNGGQPIDFGQPAGTINRDCMNESDYLPSGASSGFCSRINQSPHGIVHTLIGNTVGMGTVPWAANDPVFWLHHCNIDRMWASWNNWGRSNPSASSWLDKEFVFADENCNRVVAKVSDFAAIAPLGYAYDRLIPSFRLPPRFRDLRIIARFRDPRPDPGPRRILLEARAVNVPLVSPEGPAALSRLLPRVRSAQLVIRDLQAERAPGILYHVYLNLPARASRAAAQAYYVGAITFFDAIVPDRAQMEGMDHDRMEGGPSFDFDVTNLIRRLGRVDRLEVTLVPQGRPAERAGASVGNIELLAG